MCRIITCEQVSDGHPDKICDQIADAIVTDCIRHDRNSRVAMEVLVKDGHITIAGELTSIHRPDYRDLVETVIDRIGRERLGGIYSRGAGYSGSMGHSMGYSAGCSGSADGCGTHNGGRGSLDYSINGSDIAILVTRQSPDIALGVDKGGAGDQGIMYGYATNETPEMLPIPFAVATRFLQMLKNYPSRMFRADAKAQVSFDYAAGRITTFLCSVQHSPDVEPGDFRHIIEAMMVMAASEYGLNHDFAKLVNPTGRFVIGGSFADCGVTGRKLACDTYGGVGHIGGGALSGKDPSKVDRSGAYMARKIARDIVLAGYADRCEVQLAYAIGVAEPVGISVDTFGTERTERTGRTGRTKRTAGAEGAVGADELEAWVRKTYDLTPRGITERLGLLDVDYSRVSSYGHFGKKGLSWEQ